MCTCTMIYFVIFYILYISFSVNILCYSCFFLNHIFLFLKLASTKRLRTPPLTLRPTSCTDSSKGNFEALTSEWLSLTVGCSPSITHVPTPPPFPDHFLAQVEKPNALPLTVLQPEQCSAHGVTSLDGHFVPITPPKTLSGHHLTIPSPFSDTTLSSPVIQELIAPSISGTYIDSIENEKQFKYLDQTDSNGTISAKEVSEVFSDHRSTSETPGIDLVVSECTTGSSSPRNLASLDEQEEEICQELVTIIQGGQLNSQDSGFYRCEPQTEQHPRLYIEEDVASGNIKPPVESIAQPVISHEEYSPSINPEVFQCLTSSYSMLCCVFVQSSVLFKYFFITSYDLHQKL